MPRMIVAPLLLIATLALMSCDLTDPRLKDPCFAAILHLDTLSPEVDSVTYEWTPGECEYDEDKR